MSAQSPKLIISTGPFLKRPVDTPKVMRHVLYALAPVVLVALYLFGISALMVLLACTIGAMGTEWIITGRPRWSESTLRDGSALLTAILLALTLPPGLPIWMALMGGIVAVALGKYLFGGLGNNVFNPSLTGRAFLQASFPLALTTWPVHSGLQDFFRLRGDTFALPFMRPEFDAITAATPLAKMKFEGISTQASSLLLGNISGSIGETCALLLLAGGIYLGVRGFIKWRIPVGIFLTVAILATLLHLIDADKYPGPVQHLLCGGLMLGAIYMATDPVTSPVTPRGCWFFAAGIGILVVAIREFGGLPEGVMYSILFMNALSPLIDRWTQPRIYGAVKSKAEAA
ncbi:RnfABCDGE type electron transport complex subunit D [bacterium]|nr:RnfABCDGE type electron transport complex subunit D [bacterium]